MREYWRLLLICSIAAASGCLTDTSHSRMTHAGAAAQLNSSGLVRLISSLPPWPVYTANTFSEDEWQRYISVASEVQKLKPSVVSSALDEYMAAIIHSPGFDIRDGEESKPYLLMRFVFVLPEAARSQDEHCFKLWDNWTMSKGPDGKVNLAWPLSWQSGRPEFVGLRLGSEGHPYAARAEYEYLLARFRFRRLGK